MTSPPFLIELPNHEDGNGDITVIENLINLPFQIARVFLVRASKDALRGRHAHYLCSQFLICSFGVVEVTCTDGVESIVFELNRPNIGLYIPPGVWAEQSYKTKDALLTVLCDRKYESEDYIRDYGEFLKISSRVQQAE